MRITDLAPVAIIFVVAGIALGIGAQVLQQVQTQLTSGTTAYYAAGNATSGINQVAQWMPTIGLVVAAAIVIGVVLGSFAMGKQQ